MKLLAMVRTMFLGSMMTLVCFQAHAQPLTQTTSSRSTPQPTPLAAHLSRFDNPHIRPYAYILSTALWTSPKIYVCWDNPSAEFQADMDLVKQTVADSWESYSALSFVGWGKCAKVNRGIRITIADIGPYTRGLGRQLDTGQPGGMYLNFKFTNWSPVCQSPEMRSICIRSVAIHEFGHAVGFAHEQNRPDKPGECLQPPQGPNGDVMLTPYDKASVMNYCFNIYNADMKLSALDISAVRSLYGSEVDKAAVKPDRP